MVLMDQNNAAEVQAIRKVEAPNSYIIVIPLALRTLA
jgi:hypothetical protein